MGSLRFIVFEA